VACFGAMCFLKIAAARIHTCAQPHEPRVCHPHSDRIDEMRMPVDTPVTVAHGGASRFVIKNILSRNKVIGLSSWQSCLASI